MSSDLKKSNKETDFELDTVDSIKKLIQKNREKTSPSEPVPDTPQPVKPIGKKAFNFRMISICAATLLAITVGFIFFHHQEISFSFLTGSPEKTSKNYLRIGPVSTTLSNNKIIRFSMEILLENESAQKKLAEKTDSVKNQIITTIMAPGTAELFETGQYDRIKAQIQKNLEKATGETVSEVYFSELRTF